MPIWMRVTLSLILSINFVLINVFLRCDLLQATGSKHCTYVNDSTGYESTIDYFLINNSNVASAFELLDNFMNLSDHLPLSVRCTCNFSNGHAVDAVDTECSACIGIMPTCLVRRCK